jgi:fumarate reductase subunit C
MSRNFRIFLAALYGVCIIPATYFAMIVYGLSAMDAGPQPTPIVLSFIALPIALVIACIGEIWAASRARHHMRSAAATFFAVLPWLVVALIIMFRFSN